MLSWLGREKEEMSELFQIFFVDWSIRLVAFRQFMRYAFVAVDSCLTFPQPLFAFRVAQQEIAYASPWPPMNGNCGIRGNHWLSSSARLLMQASCA